MINAILTSHGGDSPQVNQADQLVGTVLSVQANYYWVKLDSLPLLENGGQRLPTSPSSEDGFMLLCTRRSRLKKIGQQVWVGDRVIVDEPDWIGQRGAISQVLPRSTELDRPPVANANQILLVFALAEPELDPLQLSRFLVKAESTALEVSLCLNKSDLLTPEQQRQWCDRLQQWGYSPTIISIQAQTGLTTIREQLAHRVTVISGPSGVGKSSLINHFIPTVDQRVSAVSGKLGRGRHTTRHVELFELPNGGLLADTPGFNQPDLDCTPAELGHYFPEVRQRLDQQACQFSDCLHRDEPNCAVRSDWERYEHYLTFLEEAIAHQATVEKMGDEESALKVKSGELGESRYEPKLETKRYRRPSRRQQRQTLQDLCGDIDELLNEVDSDEVDLDPMADDADRA
ncbi:MAG: small ribosomal subunit biogenesis GTPase RsgA [Synechococcales bacterium]|nr:small ribosomal subunit biogenesis GTPase RsgA [Synechococcales bacterium]